MTCLYLLLGLAISTHSHMHTCHMPLYLSAEHVSCFDSPVFSAPGSWHATASCTCCCSRSRLLIFSSLNPLVQSPLAIP